MAFFERSRRFDRRALLAGFAAAGTLATARPTVQPAWAAQPALDRDPFTLGVASGDPWPDGVVLWTRLAPEPLAGGGMSPVPYDVRWEVATDDRFATIVASGTATAISGLAHSVHVELDTLEPGRDYVYRFHAGDFTSPTGRTRTAPAPGSQPDRLRFAFSSCANWEHGYFPAYADMAAQDADFALSLGDYFYEYAPGDDYENGATPPVREHTPSTTTTLDDYRNRHAQYKTNPGLQAAHLAMPWIITWDDHEVQNNYAGVRSASGETEPDFLARRAAAYQAWYEHMLVRANPGNSWRNLAIHRAFAFGELLSVFALDTRQYRSPHPCGDEVGPRCDAAFDPAQTMLGADQEAWLAGELGASTGRWNVIAQQVMMGELQVRGLGAAPLYNNDQWDGYPLARQRLLDTLVNAGVQNPIVLSGDVHSAWVQDIPATFDDPSAPVIATEFVTTSITATNPIGPALALLLPGNPRAKFLDLRNGYAICEVTPDRWQTDFRAVESTGEPGAATSTIATFVVENGRPGAIRA